MVMFKKR